MEILKEVFDEYKYIDDDFCTKKVKEYHIYLIKKKIYITAGFPVKYMKTLRYYLRDYDYEDIIIGNPKI